MEVLAFYRAKRREEVGLTWKPNPAQAVPSGRGAPTAAPRPTETSFCSPSELVAFRNGMARKGSTEAGMSWLLGES